MKIFSSDLSRISEKMMDNMEDEVDITDELADTSDLPTSVIITNMDSDVFMDEYKKVLCLSLLFSESIFVIGVSIKN